MNYFLDTEFIEARHKPLFGRERQIIDLISIGIVCEDGREYYAVCNEFELEKENDFVLGHVLSSIYWDFCNKEDPSQAQGMHSMWGKRAGFTEFKRLLKKYGKTRKEISEEVAEFVYSGHNTRFKDESGKDIKFYGYYADYDWVLFCALFGTMMNLPLGFPMFCMDLKQMMEERGLSKEWKERVCPEPEGEHHALVDSRWNLKLFRLISKEPPNFLPGS